MNECKVKWLAFMIKNKISYGLFLLTVAFFQCCSTVNVNVSESISNDGKPSRVVGKSDVHFENDRAYYKNEEKPFNGIIQYKYKELDYEPDFDGTLKDSENIAFEIEFKNGRMDGKCVSYDFEGKTVDGIVLYKNGKKHGKWFHYYLDSDKISREGEYYNDKKHGHWIYKDNQGRIVSHEFWNKGKLIKKIKVPGDNK